MHLTSMLCNLTALVQGTWHFFNHSSSTIIESMKDPWSHCPRTLALVRTPPPEDFPLNEVTKQVERYSCFNQTYRLAIYSPHRCHIESLHSSINAMEEHVKLISKQSASNTSTMKNRMMFVGDSLMAQIYIATHCVLEENNPLAYHHFNFSYHGDFFLRPDIPCDSKCIGNPKLWNVSAEEVIFPPCFACPKGIYRPFDTFIHDRIASWIENVPKDTFALVLSTGAWYNIYKGLLDPIDSFEDTLKKIKPFLKDFISQRGIEIIWIGLPPMSHVEAEAMGGVKYGWDKFALKDALVQKHLTDIGVHFLDIQSLLSYRKLHDPAVKSDDLHWCNPGFNSVPSFIVKTLFHVFATSLKGKQSTSQSHS